MSMKISTISKLSYSNLTAQFSEQMLIASLPILAVILFNASASETAFIQFINSLPFLILSIPAGLLADKIPRKLLMIIVEVIRAIAIFFLFFLALSKGLTLNNLAIYGFLIATGTVVYSVASPALVATFVNKDQLINANRSLEISRSIAYTAGPALGGILAGIYSGIPTFVLSFTLSILSIIFLIFLPQEPPRKIARKNIFQDLVEGFVFLGKNMYLRPIVVTAFIFNISLNLLFAIFSYYAINNLSFSATEVGIALSCFGFGMILGSYLYNWISTRLNFGSQLILGPISAFIAAILMAFTILLSHKIIVFSAFFLFGFGPIIWTISTVSLRQLITPINMIARVSSVIMTVTFGARPLGAALGIYLSAKFGVLSCIVVVAAGFFIQLCIIFFSKPAKLIKLEDAIQ